MTETKEFNQLKLAEELRSRLQEQFPSIVALAATPPDEVMKRCEISKSSAIRAVNQARNHVGMSQPMTAATLLEKDLKRPRISTSSQQLDDILGGGVSIGAITEFSGSFATGKTQISFQLCVNVQRPVDKGGLEGKEIPLSARIFAIVDVWDALRSDRPYRKAWSKEKTLAHIQAESGKHFDPDVVGAFVELLQAE